jgi:hypothetical protein
MKSFPATVKEMVGMLFTFAHCTIAGPPKSNMSHNASTSCRMLHSVCKQAAAEQQQQQQQE